MCLAIPGKILTITYENDLPLGEVDFSGVTRQVCLAYTPEAQIGQYVIVHVGFSLSVLDEEEAKKTLDMIEKGFHEISQ